ARRGRRRGNRCPQPRRAIARADLAAHAPLARLAIAAADVAEQVLEDPLEPAPQCGRVGAPELRHVPPGGQERLLDEVGAAHLRRRALPDLARADPGQIIADLIEPAADRHGTLLAGPVTPLRGRVPSRTAILSNRHAPLRAEAGFTPLRPRGSCPERPLI